MAHSSGKGKLLAVIGDEDTVVGFMLGGIGLDFSLYLAKNFFIFFISISFPHPFFLFELFIAYK